MLRRSFLKSTPFAVSALLLGGKASAYGHRNFIRRGTAKGCLVSDHSCRDFDGKDWGDKDFRDRVIGRVCKISNHTHPEWVNARYPVLAKLDGNIITSESEVQITGFNSKDLSCRYFVKDGFISRFSEHESFDHSLKRLDDSFSFYVFGTSHTVATEAGQYSF